MMPNRVMNGIYNGALRKLLSQFGALDAFEGGQESCAMCGSGVNWDNLMGVFLDNGRVRFVCDDYRCYDRFEANSRRERVTSGGRRR